MSDHLHWYAVRVDTAPDGGYVKLLCVTVDGERVWREQHHSAALPDGQRHLLTERYWTNDQGRAHRTMEAALAACLLPVEDNQP